MFDIKPYREALGLTPEQMAAALCISTDRAEKTFGEWRRGEKNIDPVRMALLTAYMDGHRPKDWPTEITARYGNRTFRSMYRDINALRAAIRAEGSPAVQDAWGRCEQFIDVLFKWFFRKGGNTK